MNQAYKNILLDLDGTVYIDDQIIDKADAEIIRLSKKGFNFFYLTNNTSKNTNNYIAKLRNFNLPVNEKSIISPIDVVVDWIKKNNYSRIYLVGVEALKEELSRKTGVFFTSQDPECIIIGFDKELTYQKLETASKLIHLGVSYFLTHIDYYCPTFYGKLPDCGSIGLMLEKSTGVKSSGHFGKPGKYMIDHIKNKIKENEKSILVGDRIYTDIETGLKVGARTILVCSGEFKNNSQDKLVSEDVEIFPTLAEFLRTL